VAKSKRRCIRILQVQPSAADAVLGARPQGKACIVKLHKHTAIKS